MAVNLFSREETIGHALNAEFRALRERDQARMVRYLDAETRYERSRSPERIVWLGNDDYGNTPKNTQPPKRHKVPLNYEHAITQKHTHRIAGRPPDILVPGNDRSARERFRADTIEKMIYGVYRYSDWEEQMASGAFHASLLGAACFDVWMPDSGPQLPYVRELHPGSVLAVQGIDRVHDYE